MTVNISQEQAKAFASAIFPDIATYIESHREEFEEFLRDEAANEGGSEACV